MKDTRVDFFRKSLEGLIESLDATVRVARWTDADAVPEPLKQSASRLVERLGTADRLASGTFRGTPADNTRVSTMLTAMRRLDAAYVLYRQQLERTPADTERAATALDAELEEVTARASWRQD